MDENDKSWNGFRDFLATDMIKERERTINAFKVGIICITVFFTVAIIGALAVIYGQNKNFVSFLSDYNFVTQDGEGYNYYNSNIDGGVRNGSANNGEEESQDREGSSD